MKEKGDTARLKVEEHILRKQQESLRNALNAGVKIAFGTDAGVYPHGDNGKQFYVMTQLGMSSIEVIRSATIYVANLLGWEDKVGSIAKGKFADIIAVQMNPLEEIKVLENVGFVMKGGKIYKNEISE